MALIAPNTKYTQHNNNTNSCKMCHTTNEKNIALKKHNSLLLDLLIEHQNFHSAELEGKVMPSSKDWFDLYVKTQVFIENI